MIKKKILVLGASGFIGKNILLHFINKKNYKVYGTYFKNKFKTKGAKLYKADLTKKKDVEMVIKGKDIVIQAAATTSGAKDILSNPYIHVNDNAIITKDDFKSKRDEILEIKGFGVKTYENLLGNIESESVSV